MPDYYNLLGVPPGADAEAIRRAFRSRAKQAHPDAHPSGSPAEREALKRRFILLAQAYDTLRDPARRAAYDRSRPRREHARRAEPGAASAAGAGAATGSAAWRSHRATFGRARRAPAAGGAPGPDESLESLLYDAEVLLARFGLDLRHPLEELLDALLEWALGVFRQTVEAWEHAGAETASAQTAAAPGREDRQRKTARTASEKGRAPAGEPAIEEELRRLKRRRGGKR